MRIRGGMILLLLIVTELSPALALAQTTTPAATPLASPVVSGPPTGLLVMQAVGQDQALLHKNLVVAAPDGTNRHDVTSDMLLALYPTPDSTHAIVETINSAIFVLDPARQRLLPVAMPADAAASLIVLAISNHWALLGTTHGEGTYLVNLESGATSVLPALTAEEWTSRVGVISPDEQTALLVAGGALWLVPTAHPDQRHQVATNALVPLATFSDDSHWIVYTANDLKSAVWSLVVVRADGTNQTTIATNARPISGAFVPGSQGRQLIVQRPGEVVRLTMANHQEQSLVATNPEEFPAGIWFSPSGRHLILRTVTPQSSASGSRWTWLDLASGRSTQLTTLNDLNIPELGTKLRWILATGILPSNLNTPGIPMYSLDTETGEIKLLFKSAAKTIYVATGPQRLQTADGRFRIVLTIGTSNPVEQLLLSDAATGTTRSVASGAQIGAALSPDGRWLAVSAIVQPGRNSPVQSQLVPLDGSAARPLAGGFVIGWLAGSTGP